MTRSGLAPWKEFSTISTLFRLYRRIKPDLVHHLRLKPVLYGGLAAYGARVPAVVGLLTGLGYVFIAESRRALVMRKLVVLSCKVAFRHSNQRIVFQNPDDQGVFIQNKILPAAQTVLIKGSGVDVHTYVPTPEPEGVPVVVLASRMLRDKGVVEFVEAARELARSRRLGQIRSRWRNRSRQSHSSQRRTASRLGRRRRYRVVGPPKRHAQGLVTVEHRLPSVLARRRPKGSD